MKTILIVLSLIFILTGFAFQNESANYKNQKTEIEESKFKLYCPDPVTSIPLIGSELKKSDSKDIEQCWYQKAIENIQRDEYSITYDEKLGAYQSPNRENNIRFIYHKDGFTAKARTLNSKKGQWDVKLQVKDCGLINEDSKNELQVTENKAFVENDKIRIDYKNDKDGMRQDFIIKQKPEAEGMLKLNIEADTKLNMIVGADALMFKDKDGIDKLKYSSLKCWDANGRELRAYFEDNSKLRIANHELQNKNESDQRLKIKDQKSFTIVVNDEDAVYPITIDPLSSTPGWTKQADQTDANYGYSVSTAGDLDGDGYSAVIIGSPDYDNGQSNEGMVFVFDGSSYGLPATASWYAQSNQTDAFFGGSVSTAGDVNGDGYSDIIVGASQYDSVETDEGWVFVWYGSASGLGASGTPFNADWHAQNNQANSDLGNCVSTAGDVNGDGYSDIIVGARLYDNVTSNRGAAFVWYGSSTGLGANGTNSNRDWYAESNQTGAQFGWSLSTAGDVNGDGYSDVIIGARNFDNGQSSEGYVWMWYGSSTGLGADGNVLNYDWYAESNQADAHFGYSVATAGDVNGDGYSDVLIGAPDYDNGQTDEGSVYLWLGGATGPVANGTPLNANWSAQSDQASAQLGFSVSTAGDINGDGFSDVVIGAPYYDSTQTNEGRAFVWYGSSSDLGADGTRGNAGWTYVSGQDSAQFGYSVFTAGDINGDGYSDVIAGANLYETGENNEGQAYVFNGAPTGLSAAANFTKAGTANSEFFGANVSSAGDVNGDGYSDVLVSAPYFDGGQTDEGIVYLFGGSATGLKPTAFASIEGNQDSANFGASASTAGDVNGDGYCDVIIGAPLYNNGENNEGRAYIYFGSALTPYLTFSTSVESNQADAHFGASVSTAGDVNGDGYSDVIVGADYYDNGQTDEGKAFVYYGSATGISAAANWTTESDQTSAQLGNAVATAGDVNDDGYSDILVGSSYYDNGNTDEGRVNLYYGSSIGLSSAAKWTGESDQNSGRFGFSLSTAGDVNGDGYADILVGAVLYNNGQSNEGAVFLWYGSATGPVANGTPSNANWYAESNQGFAQLGWSVSTAGDVNGDGYSDIIAGARLYDNGESNEGSAFCWYGSPSGLGANGTPSNADWSAESNQASAFFGVSVSTAGDVNGDGYSDVIVGAQGYDNGFTENGQVFVYHGNGGNGLQSTVRQYKPGTTNILYSGGSTGTAGQVRLNIFAKSPFGRADGKLIFESRANGVPYSGDTITNSTSQTGAGTNTDLGTLLKGINLNYDISGLAQNKEFKWRARVEYNPANNPYQSLSPWKYYTNYIPVPFGCFKAITIDDDGPAVSYTNLTDSVGGGTRYLTGVTISDASGVNGTSGNRPRIYYKVKSDSNIYNDNTNATDGWKYSEASNSNSPFGFIINYSRLNGGISVLDTIQYFVIAQDIRTFGPVHVGKNSCIFASAPDSVRLTSAAFPVTGTINSYIITDNVAPSISFTNIADTASLTNKNFTNVAITDVSGVNGTAGTRPRVYYKKINNPNQYIDNTNATAGWKYAEATGSTSPFSFVINYSLIFGGLQTSDSLVYFVVAQDNASTPNVKIVQGTFSSSPASVDLTSAAFPIGGTLKGYKIIDLGAPAISFTNLADTASLINRTFSNVVITDSSGIQGSSGFRPRVYFKRKTDANTFIDNTNTTAGWKYASATGSSSPFSFIMNYSLMNGSVAVNDTVQYFIVAQDKYIPPYTAINSGTFAASPSLVDLTSAAFPIGGTINSYAILSPPFMNLYLNVLIQGFYDAGSDSRIQDTVKVFLRNSTFPYAKVDSSKTFLEGSGKTGPLNTLFTYSNAVSNVPYYIQVTHRNSIETWSSSAVSFVSSELYYDFTDAAAKSYGSNLLQVNTAPVRFALFGGDINQDGTVDASDVSETDNDAYSSLSGYVNTDLTGDDFVDAADVSLVDNNAYNSVSAVTP
jgi:hypothetical protein